MAEEKLAFFGDRLTFRLTVTKVGRSSMAIEHTVHCGDEPRWSGHQVLAASWLDKHTSMTWPDDVRTKLVSFLPQEQAADAHQPVKRP